MLRKRGNTYHYDFEIDNKRYRGSCKTTDKKLAENIADTIKADILRSKHNLPSKITYIFADLFSRYLDLQQNNKNKDLKICCSNHFLPVFKDKNIKHITRTDILNYQLKRKLEILSLSKKYRQKRV